MLALHGLKSSRRELVRTAGLQRPDSAYFLLPLDRGKADDRRLVRTCALAVYFSISLSTMRQWAAAPDRHHSLVAWYRERPKDLPAILAFRLTGEDRVRSAYAGANQYTVALRSETGPSFPYTKVSIGGAVPAELLLPEASVELTQDDVAAAGTDLELDPRVSRMRGEISVKPFFAKDGHPLPHRPRGRLTNLVDTVPEFCERLGRVAARRLREQEPSSPSRGPASEG